jgi:hypothetical protein
MLSMFKIGETPLHSEDAIHHADFIELECLRQSDKSYSGHDLSSAFGRVSDDLPEDRPELDEDIENAIIEAYSKLSDRVIHSARKTHRYPFRLDDNYDLLFFDPDNDNYDLYLFLLTATRLNMGSDRIHAEIDGTMLFEQVCCEVAKTYWGEGAEALVFGTARRENGREVKGFEAAIDDLCRRTGEGNGFNNNYFDRITAQDGKLDVVVWKSFSDQRCGKLMGLGQCKTGTRWRNGLFSLQPRGFYQKWVHPMPLVDPVRLYFITS